MELTLIKTKNYKLEPYGKFTIKWKTRQGWKPNIIPFDELDIFHETTMPLTPEQDKEVVKYMKKHKTDILTDGSYFGFYTRAGNGFAMIRHPKLMKYKEDETFKNIIDLS